MKRLASLILVLLICLSAVSCTDKEKSSSAEESKTIESSVSTEETSANSEETTSDIESSADETSDAESSADETSDAESSADDSDKEPSKPALFKVIDDDGDIAWLFGSIHISDDGFYPLPDYVMEAFEGADALAVEADIIAFQEDFVAALQAGLLIMYNDGTTVKDHLSKETYDAAVKILKENNMYLSMYDQYKPCMFESLISGLIYKKLGFDTENGVDATLINKAYSIKKPVYEVESVEFQYGMLGSFSDELQELLLQGTIESYNDLTKTDVLEALVSSWAKGDVEGLRKCLAEETEFENDKEKELYEEYNKAMTTDRDIGMTEYVEEALDSGEELFICVGAAHVIGETGIIYQLEQKGYTVERIGA